MSESRRSSNTAPSAASQQPDSSGTRSSESQQVTSTHTALTVAERSPGASPSKTIDLSAPTITGPAPNAQSSATASQMKESAAAIVPAAPNRATALAREQRQHPAQRSSTGGVLLGLFLGLALAAIILAFGALLGGFNRIWPTRTAGTDTRARLLQTITAEDPGITGPSAGIHTVATPGAPLNTQFAVGARFQDLYNTRGGLNMLGTAISAPMVVNGREIQWFERARIEHWPKYAGTPYEIQLGRLGVEYTIDRDFPDQVFFVSNPNSRYFGETSQSVSERFLRFWEQNGGLDVLGSAISDEFDERLPDGTTRRVQYFERMRLEYHPDHAGTANEIQVGLLGGALYLNESRPDTIPAAPLL
ncbi:MAG: hypothetical protein MI924_35585 [Chloroflexales bacterium]|nr:hypothetical protein [Chloroflexales bacterium]